MSYSNGPKKGVRALLLSSTILPLNQADFAKHEALIQQVDKRETLAVIEDKDNLSGQESTGMLTPKP